MEAVKRYGWNLLIALDQLANVLFGPLLNAVLRPKAATFGDPDETLSSRCWRWERAGRRSWPREAVDSLFEVFFWDLDHCEQSYESERLGRQLPPELRPKAAP